MEEPTTDDPILADVAAIGRIPSVPLILDVVCRATGMGFAAVARVTEDRWVACSVKDDIQFGLKPGGELKIKTTICDEIRDSRLPVVIDEVATDLVYRNHHTPALYGLQSYLSMPIIRADGRFFGTLCVIDPRPMKLDTPEIVGLFKLLAELIATHLDEQDRLAIAEAALRAEQENRALREQFIAMLGHDLRTPLAAVNGGMRLMLPQLNEQGRYIMDMVLQSTRRMNELIGHVLDLARERIGEGLRVERAETTALESTIRQVLGELRRAWPERVIEEEVSLPGSLRCDPARISQLLSNLVANAFTHGAADQPVQVRAVIEGNCLSIRVTNRGIAIPVEVMDKLFEPYFRAAEATKQEGLGLGLYIASAVAREHGGALAVDSTAERTCFTFTMPLA